MLRRWELVWGASYTSVCHFASMATTSVGQGGCGSLLDADELHMNRCGHTKKIFLWLGGRKWNALCCLTWYKTRSARVYSDFMTSSSWALFSFSDKVPSVRYKIVSCSALCMSANWLSLPFAKSSGWRAAMCPRVASISGHQQRLSGWGIRILVH